MSLVDPVAHRLADQVRGDREALEAVAVEDLPASVDVARVGERLVDVEVIAPAGELEAVEAPAPSLVGELLERQVGPLAGEERDRTCHSLSSLGGGGSGGALTLGQDEVDARSLVFVDRRARKGIVDDECVELLRARDGEQGG